MLQVAGEVEAALAAGRGVVALETSIVAQGLPAPHNLEAAIACEEAIRAAGCVPATVAILEGAVRIGLTATQLRRVATEGAQKVSARDLGHAVAAGIAGATTVAATVRAAGLAGIRFMATGGVGGVHRGHPEDVSADLEELAREPVAVFCAGPKMILDIGLTMERLETLSVPVIGFATDEVPAFYTRSSGRSVSARVDTVAALAAVLKASWQTGVRGILVTVPPPSELEGAEEAVIQAAGELSGVSGSAVTPRLLARVAELTGGRSLSVNVELVVNNARVAAESAAAFAAP